MVIDSFPIFLSIYNISKDTDAHLELLFGRHQRTQILGLLYLIKAIVHVYCSDSERILHIGIGICKLLQCIVYV